MHKASSTRNQIGRPLLVTFGLATLYLFAAALTANPYVLLIMTLVPIWATVGVSWNVFSGYSGLLSFGHAAFFGLGAYTLAVGFAHFGLSPWIGLLAAAAVGALAGAVVGVPTFRLRGVYFSLAMLAYPLALLYVFEWLGLQEVALPLKREGAVAYMQFSDPRAYVLLAVAMLVGALLINLWIGRSRFGLSLLAVKQNELAAEASGINPFRWKLLALVLSGAIAGVAGGLYAVVLVIVTPHSVFGMLVSAQALIFTMFGGVGRIAGPVLGALILLPLGELLNATLGARLPGIQGVIYGAAIILIVLMAPEGVLPRLTDAWQARRGRRGAGATAAPAAAASLATNGPVAPAVPAAAPPAPGGELILRVQGLSKRFGGLQAVQDVAFDVRRGEILGIIGPNGAGKTTMFNLLNGMVAPTSGSIVFEGQELRGLRSYQVCRLGVGRTFQVVRPFARLSVLENVVIGAFAAEPDDALAYGRAMEALRQVGLEPYAQVLAGGLPAVQLRLMEIARALASRPKLLLLDEVLAGLGGGEVEQVMRALTAIRDAGVTIVIIEHTMHAMVRLANRLLVLDHGKVLYVGEPAAVTSEPAVIEAYLGKKWVGHAAH
ncbi:branched-chain amino acid ABC transporter ATP-binding protein/permease [Ramlibacter sp. 2FC]|uniref:branched-chain amino acid ABC transporter ATP-binding protein/permease n=1 Tax=Ramlibacter sp. 2FC TaxID=2502188 RepID=UPI00201DB859|nr:branched-chain amino acid ABC transporter ATP-binding protein/permease [Ramlibacter sp. 2FC]